ELRRDHRLPAALRVELEDITQNMAWGHRDPSAIRVEAIVDHLRRRLCRPRDTAHRLGIRLEDDVDLRRTHGLGGLERVVAGNGLQEDTFRQPHAAVLRKFLRGHDLAPGNAGHVWNDRFDLGNAVVTEKLPDFTHHWTAFLYAGARDSPTRRPRITPGKTDYSSPATRDATARRPQSPPRRKCESPLSGHRVRVPRPRGRVRGAQSLESAGN